jgi:hypothetical protein
MQPMEEAMGNTRDTSSIPALHHGSSRAADGQLVAQRCDGRWHRKKEATHWPTRGKSMKTSGLELLVHFTL